LVIIKGRTLKLIYKKTSSIFNSVTYIFNFFYSVLISILPLTSRNAMKSMGFLQVYLLYVSAGVST
jgi:IS4 transposase